MKYLVNVASGLLLIPMVISGVIIWPCLQVCMACVQAQAWLMRWEKSHASPVPDPPHPPTA